MTGHSDRVPGFLVLASPKSGTTWMQRMLCAHPDAHCIESRAWGESYIPFERGRYHVNADHYARFLTPLLGIWERDPSADAPELAKAIHAAVIAWASDATGKAIIGEKCTPYEGGSRLALKRFVETNPELPILHLVRDPRDVLVSAFVHHHRAHPPADPAQRLRHQRCLEGAAIPDEAIPRWVGNWRDVVEAAAEAEATHGNLMELRYERLVAETETQMRCVLRHFGLECDDATTRGCVESATFERLSGRRRGEEDRGDFFRKGVAGDWRNWLTDEQCETVERLAGPRFGELYGAESRGASADARGAVA